MNLHLLKVRQKCRFRLIQTLVYDESSDSDIQFQAEDSSTNNILPVVSVGSFVIVKVYSKPLICKSFVAQIICGPDEDMTMK